MNIKPLISCFFATALAFAQFPWDAPSSEASTQGSSEEASGASPQPFISTPAPVSSSSAAKEPAAGKTIFDKLRGHAYNPYSTQGAASTVGDLVLVPSDISGQKFFYVAPTDGVGYAAFEMGGGSALLGLNNSTSNLAALIFGYAFPGFGLALDYSVSKEWYSDKDLDESGRITNPGDNIGLYFSLPLGSLTIYANGRWLTYAQSSSIDYDGDVDKWDYSAVEANLGLKSKFGSLDYDGHLSVIRTGGTHIDPDGDKFIDPYTYSGLILGLDLGFTASQISDARVIVGLNTAFGALFYDEIGNTKSDNVMGLVISPNLLGEAAIFENWLAFAGAMHSISFLAGDGDRNNKTSETQITHSNGTNAYAGIRYQKNSWAFEAQVSANVFNNPFGGFAGIPVLANFGGFIYF